MLLKAIFAQTIQLLKKREAIFVFMVLFLMVSINFVGNVLCFQGRDVLEMYHPMKILLLSYNRVNFNASNTMLLIQLYPLLVVAVAGFSMAKEYQLGLRVYMISRLGKNQYQISKLLSVFIATVVVFTVPFLLEILLNCISFPAHATGDLLNSPVYDNVYIESIDQYFMKDIYLISPYLYSVIGTLIFGLVSGLLGMFTAAISLIFKVKYNVVLFLPVFIILNISTVLGRGKLMGGSSMHWYSYVLLFNDEPKSITIAVICILVFIAITIAVLKINRGRVYDEE